MTAGPSGPSGPRDVDRPPAGSYRARDEHRDPEAELARLRAQVDLTWPAELRHLRALGLGRGRGAASGAPSDPAGDAGDAGNAGNAGNAGTGDPGDPGEGAGRVLETGCGPGYVLERWRESFPADELTGLDSDPQLLQRARAAPAGPGGGGIRWILGDALRAPFPGRSFDLVLARFLWQHLADPARAASEARRLLRPGGRVVVVDVDAELWGVAHPVFPEVIPIWVKHGRAQARRGGDRRIGRKLYRLLAGAGFRDVRLDVIAVSSDEVGLEPFLPQLDPDRQLVARREGAVSEAEMEVLRSAHRRFVEHPDAFVLMTHFVATGVAP